MAKHIVLDHVAKSTAMAFSACHVIIFSARTIRFGLEYARWIETDLGVLIAEDATRMSSSSIHALDTAKVNVDL